MGLFHHISVVLLVYLAPFWLALHTVAFLPMLTVKEPITTKTKP